MNKEKLDETIKTAEGILQAGGAGFSVYEVLLSQAVQALKHKRDFFSPDPDAPVALIARLMTRNETDRIKQAADRLQFQRNVSNLTTHPALHLGFCVRLMDQYAQAGKPATFEIGLVMGAAIAFASCSRSTEKLISQMLGDIASQQDCRTQGETGNEEAKNKTEDQGKGAQEREGIEAQPPLQGEYEDKKGGPDVQS